MVQTSHLRSSVAGRFDLTPTTSLSGFNETKSRRIRRFRWNLTAKNLGAGGGGLQKRSRWQGNEPPRPTKPPNSPYALALPAATSRAVLMAYDSCEYEYRSVIQLAAISQRK